MSRRRKEKGKINIVNLANYVSPDIRVEKTKEWVTYSHNNSYFIFIRQIFGKPYKQCNNQRRKSNDLRQRIRRD